MSKIYKINNHLMEYKDSCINYKVNPNPLNLPDNTIRVKFFNGYIPEMGDTQTLVDSTNNVWDIYKQSNNWKQLFFDNNNVLEVLGANTTNVTNMAEMFRWCQSLNNVALFNTSNVTNMNQMFSGCISLTSVPLFDLKNVNDCSYMFSGCRSLTSVPLFDTSSVVYMNTMFQRCDSLKIIPLLDTSSVVYIGNMFEYCYNVESGALAFYQQVSTQANPPTYHTRTFRSCGRDTVTGAAELAQIPDDWK